MTKTLVAPPDPEDPEVIEHLPPWEPLDRGLLHEQEQQ
jgi:hypothetical protein